MFLSMYGPEIWGPRIQDAFRNFASLLSHDPEGPGTLVDLLWAVNLRNDTVRERFEAIARSTGSISHTLFLQQIQERRMGDGSLQELVSYYRAKFSPFVDNPTLRLVLGQRRSTLDVQRFIRERRVCLFNLSKGRISSRYATLLGRVLVTRIFQAAIASGSLPAAERPPVMLVLDEFQNLVSPSIEDIVAEARKFRLSLVVANQHISQVDRNLTDVRSGGGVLDALLGNIGALVSFRVSGSDAQRLAAEMGPDMPADALSGLPPWNAVCHLSRGGASLPPFTLRTRPLVPRRDRRVAEKVLRRSRQEVCVPRDQAERAIRARVLACTGQVETPEDAMSALFRSL
jgi:DNA helicase HerA-like ATPase